MRAFFILVPMKPAFWCLFLTLKNDVAIVICSIIRGFGIYDFTTCDFWCGFARSEDY